jgi:hypothetical protein
LGKSLADSFVADVGSTEGSHSVSSDSFLDVAPGLMPKEQMMSTGSATDADDMLEANELNIESHDLAIVTHARHSFEHERGDSDTADPDAVPLSFSVQQTILTGGVAGMFSFLFLLL